MEKGLLMVMLLLVGVLALSLAGATVASSNTTAITATTATTTTTRSIHITPNATLSPDCDAAEMVVGEGQTKRVVSMESSYKHGDMRKVYVKFEKGFQSVHLEVAEKNKSGTSNIVDTWLPVENCVSPSGSWVELGILTKRVLNLPILYVLYGTCFVGCGVNIPEGRSLVISLESGGHSSWTIVPPPQGCSVISPLEERQLSCQPSPPATTIIVLSVVVVVLVVVVVVLVWWKRRFMKLPNVMRFLSQPAAASQPLQLTAGQGHAPGQDEGRRVVVPQPAAPCRPPQPTAGQGHAPDQAEEHIYYELLPDDSERRVVVPQPAQDVEAVYHDVLPPASPIYANVPPGGGGAPPPGHLLLAAGQRESELYATVI